MEGSPSGLWRTLGKRVGCKPSRVRIPLPPPGRVARSKRPGDFLLQKEKVLNPRRGFRAPMS